MATRRSLPGSGPKSGVTNSQASVPAYSDRLSQLGKDMAEIRYSTMKEMIEKLQRLSYEIEDINRRFDSLDRTHRRYFQHAHFIPIVGVGKRGEC